MYFDKILMIILAWVISWPLYGAVDDRDDPISKKKLSPYTLNFAWILNQADPDTEYVFPAKDETKLKKLYLDHLVGWATAHNRKDKSNCTAVRVHYDGRLLPPAAVLRTEEFLKANYDLSQAAPIVFYDIWESKLVQAHQEIFDPPTLPVYFRADLYRVMAAVESTDKCFIYSDCDFPPNDPAHVFSDFNTGNLDTYGFVYMSKSKRKSKARATLLENPFFMILKDHRLAQAVSKEYMETGIYRGQRALKEGTYPKKEGLDEKGDPFPGLRESMYELGSLMYHTYLIAYCLEALGQRKGAEIKWLTPEKTELSVLNTIFSNIDTLKKLLEFQGLTEFESTPSYRFEDVYPHKSEWKIITLLRGLVTKLPILETVFDKDLATEIKKYDDKLLSPMIAKLRRYSLPDGRYDTYQKGNDPWNY